MKPAILGCASITAIMRTVDWIPPEVDISPDHVSLFFQIVGVLVRDRGIDSVSTWFQATMKPLILAALLEYELWSVILLIEC